MSKDFPSLDKKHEPPSGWIQWKGTNVCIDIYCICGHHSHYDGDFLYHYKCPECLQVYEVDGNVVLHPLAHEPRGTRTTERLS